jgi:S1-C subfamily serine protease
MRLKTRTACTAAAVALAALTARAAPELDRSVFRVVVTQQEQDQFQPWQMRHHGTRSGFAAAVSSNTILTTESLVRGQRLVEFMRAGRGDRTPARLLAADSRINLALLEIERLPPDLRLVPLAAATGAPPENMSAVFFGRTTRIETAPARLQRTAVDRLPSSRSQMLQFTVITDMQSEDNGVPLVTDDGKLAGLVMDYQRVDRNACVVPAEVLSGFVADVLGGGHLGVAGTGFSWQPLVDPVHRRYLGMDPHGPGILVLSTSPGSGAAPAIRPGDVILSWNGQQIDNMGYYTDPVFGSLLFTHLVSGRGKPGDPAVAKIWRDGRESGIKVTLAAEEDSARWIPDNVEGFPDDYLVAFGLVVRELTGRYLMSYGPDWRVRTDARLVHLYLTARDNPPAPGARIVIVSSVLPDDANIGYQTLRDDIVTHVNGVPVLNMEDVFRAVGDKHPVRSIRVKDIGTDLVFDPADSGEADARIARQYGIDPSRLRRRTSNRGEGGRP